LERLRASFDKLRMRAFHCATKISPHPELVEGRRMLMQREDVRIAQRCRRRDNSNDGIK